MQYYLMTIIQIYFIIKVAMKTVNMNIKIYVG